MEGSGFTAESEVIQTSGADKTYMDEGRLYYFDQRSYTNAWDYAVANIGLYGAVYVPDKCIDGTVASCNLNVNLGGCGTKTAFFRGGPTGFVTGMGPVSHSNNMIVLSVHRRDMCWNNNNEQNWDGALYKSDPQARAIKAMIDQITSPRDSSVDLMNMPNDIAEEYFKAVKANDQTTIDALSIGTPSSADETGHFLSRQLNIWWKFIMEG